MKIKRDFDFTDSYQSRCGILPYGIPSVRKISKGNIENLVSMLGDVNIIIDLQQSHVGFSLDGSYCSASLKEYVDLDKKDVSLDRYVLKGYIRPMSSLRLKSSEKIIEIGLANAGRSYGGETLGGEPLIGGEVTVVRGISGYIVMDTAPPGNTTAKKKIKQYFEEIEQKIGEWGETCRIPGQKGAWEEQIERNCKKILKMKPKPFPYNNPQVGIKTKKNKI